MIIGGSSSQDLAAHVARELGEELCYVETKKFPDGERYLRITEDVKDKEITVIQSTGYPQDENLMELLIRMPKKVTKNNLGYIYFKLQKKSRSTKIIKSRCRKYIIRNDKL